MPEQSNSLALSAQNDLSPMQMIRVAFDAAITQGSAMEVVNAILEQQRWMIRHDEEQAFNAALKRIQKQLQIIPKRGYNSDNKSSYAKAEDVDAAIQKLLDAEEMTLSFKPAISEKMEEVVVIGILSLGAFSKEYPLPMPADGKGAKGGGVMSRTHATGAAITYAKRYLKNMIFDLRFKEKDDDGNGASGKRVSEEDFTAMVDNIKAAGTKELGKVFQGAYEFARDTGDKETMQALVRVKDDRKRELGL